MTWQRSVCISHRVEHLLWREEGAFLATPGRCRAGPHVPFLYLLFMSAGERSKCLHYACQRM